ncbi:hypothetical protein AX16_006258 [Volvariella volvacea WC 439]|nr:hypothetical protein AX16_006258 [Volvariella volvacea WC 439]
MTVSSQPQPNFPQAISGYALPAPSSSASSRASSTKPGQKPVNVFSNDGSFLERFQRARKEEEDKKKELEAADRKKAFNDRFKNRGKRGRPTATPSTEPSQLPTPYPSASPNARRSPTAPADEPPVKRRKTNTDERDTSEQRKSR